MTQGATANCANAAEIHGFSVSVRSGKFRRKEAKIK
jgi:hypothetical protein